MRRQCLPRALHLIFLPDINHLVEKPCANCADSVSHACATVFERLDAGETKTFYLRVLSGSNTAFPMTMWVPAELDRQDHRDPMTFGIIYGILIAFIVYFAALALNLKKPAFMWFTFYIFCLGLLLSCYQGYLQALPRSAFADLIRVVLISVIGCLYFTGAKYLAIGWIIGHVLSEIDLLRVMAVSIGTGTMVPDKGTARDRKSTRGTNLFDTVSPVDLDSGIKCMV
jgi:hypothetical protein